MASNSVLCRMSVKHHALSEKSFTKKNVVIRTALIWYRGAEIFYTGLLVEGDRKIVLGILNGGMLYFKQLLWKKQAHPDVSSRCKRTKLYHQCFFTLPKDAPSSFIVLWPIAANGLADWHLLFFFYTVFQTPQKTVPPSTALGE